MSDESQRCEQCVYYDQNRGGFFGWCRIRAPVTSENGTFWPEVNQDDWCGEFRAKPPVAKNKTRQKRTKR